MRGVGLVLASGRQHDLVAGRPDALAELDGRPLVAYAAHTLTATGAVDQVVVCAPDGAAAKVHAALAADPLVGGGVADRRIVVVEGSREQPAVRRAADAADVVLVHDVHRPLSPPHLVDLLLAAIGEGADVAVPVAEVTETVKELDPHGWIVRTVPRETLRQVQTPRATRVTAVCDDAEWPLRTAAGARTVTVLGHPDAFAVSTGADLDLAAAVLRARGHITPQPASG